jgi:hypothetical protein
MGDRLRKRLTPNDLGLTGSHQAGFHIPKELARYFPALNEGNHNPDCWLTVRGTGSATPELWRFTHYNNGVVGAGTRDEYRITHTRAFLRLAGARPGDVLEFERLHEAEFNVRIPRIEELGVDRVLLLQTSGPWSLVRLGRS